MPQPPARTFRLYVYWVESVISAPKNNYKLYVNILQFKYLTSFVYCLNINIYMDNIGC